MSRTPTRAAPSATLATEIEFLPSVGPRRAELFRRLNITTLAELIKHIPYRYEYHHGHVPINELPIDTIATARGVVVACRWVPGRGSPIGRPSRGGKGRFTAAIEDQTGRLDLVFFNARFLADKIHPGEQMTVTGRVALYNGHRQMANPNLRVEEDPAPEFREDSGPSVPNQSKYTPIYPATENLPSVQIQRIIADLLPTVLPQIDDHLSEVFRLKRNLPELSQTYQLLHAPADADDVGIARRRLAYDELLLLQIAFALKRKYTQTQLRSPALRYSRAIDEHIRSRFPFELTTDQAHVASQIATDLQKSEPMNRLLQGDVGSGKTVVALYALLIAVASNKQGAIMAPTELLAEQHFLSISDMLKGSNVRIALLTGSIIGPQRTALVYKLEKGEIDIVIGTHAIIAESVRFKELAVIVVDEQHRFGVMQRATARTKAGETNIVPHTLVMTATPIPRTMGLAMFGDLDISTIAHSPPGRQPITTRVVPPDKTDEVYRYVATRIAEGEQAYVVVPAIDESESGLKAVRSHVAWLQETHFANINLAAMHGRLKPVTRERLMQRFRDGKIDVLIATTVIEVGMDVPNASIMIVEHAERFGLAQLHQLRGRVGRGERKSLCVFIADATTEDAQVRMAAIGSTTDGFQISEADLNIRGIGEMLGTRQSGLPPLRIADLTRHLDLLQLARRDANQLIESDPTLSQPEHELLRKRLLKQYGEAIGLADVA